MATTRTWDPFGEMLRLRETMTRLTESALVRPGALTFGYAESIATQTFPLNIHGTADELKVEALLPGISQEDVQIDIDRGVLTIAAKRVGPDAVEGERWHLREFNPGQFTRSVALPFPVEIDRASANFTNGVLTLTLPKAEAAKPRRIQVGAGRPQQGYLGAGEAESTHATGRQRRVQETTAHN